MNQLDDAEQTVSELRTALTARDAALAESEEARQIQGAELAALRSKIDGLQSQVGTVSS